MSLMDIPTYLTSDGGDCPRTMQDRRTLWSCLSSVPSQGCHRIESVLTYIALFSTDMPIVVVQELNSKSQIQYDWVGAFHCGLVFYQLLYHQNLQYCHL